MPIYCNVCAKPIGEWDDASYHGNNLYKHHRCFSMLMPPPLFHRRTISFSFYYFDIEKESKKAIRLCHLFQKFGAKVLAYSPDDCFLIYPDDLPERFAAYNGDVPCASEFWGCSGLRQEVIDKLPATLDTELPPSYLFKNYQDLRIFRPIRLRKTKGGIKW